MSAAPVAQNKGAQAYLPDFCAAGTVFVVVVIAELIAILLTLALSSFSLIQHYAGGAGM